MINYTQNAAGGSDEYTGSFLIPMEFYDKGSSSTGNYIFDSEDNTYSQIRALDKKFDQVRGELRVSFDTEPLAKEDEYIFDYGSTRYFFTADFFEFINAPENSLYKEALEMTLDSANKLIEKVVEEERQKHMQDS